MKLKIYLETSIISYLTAMPSRDIILAAHQQITREWWETRRTEYELFISQLVIQESSSGDPEAVKKRLAILNPLALLDLNSDVLALARKLLENQLLPNTATEDAMHIAIATSHQMDYLLTWNCRHIANPVIQRKITKWAHLKDYELPTICTPIEFSEV